MADRLIVKGAREHNLRSIDLDLPRDALIVFTGLVRARASRRWRSTRSSPRASAATSSRCRRTRASSSARWTSPTSTSSRVCRPRCRSTRSRPTATRARPSAPSPRSTTTCGCCTPAPARRTARSAVSASPRQTPQQIVDQVLAMEEGTRFQVLAPVVRTRKGEFVDLFDKLNTQGYSRVRVDGVVHPLTDAADAEEAGEARHRGRRRPAHREGQFQAAAHRLGRDGAEPRRRHRGAGLRRPAEDATRTASSASPRSSPAPTVTRWPSTTSSRGRSRSTRRTAPARSAPASASARRSTPTSSSPTRS